MRAGEYKILAMGNVRNVLISQEKKGAVDWVRVNPIVVGSADIIVPKKGPHPNAARLFIEWQLSSRIQQRH